MKTLRKAVKMERNYNKYPFDECEYCKTIIDCPHPDVDLSGFGVPMPPDCCPRPMDIMIKSERDRKLNKLSNKN